MSRVASQTLEALDAAVDMVDLVGARTPLRRSGARYVGRCPFHEERTPSFSVDPVKKVYYCFGCQRGGDHIRFVQETENVDFAGAVESLADRYGVRVEYERSSPEDERRRAQRGRLLQLLADAAAFYGRYLWESAEAAPARAYLAERGISDETARAFGLGFSPSAWDRVCAAALGKGFTAAELDQAGLSGRGRRGPVDRFRSRLMFPLADARGRVRGFGARQMPGGEPPKYLNSPDRRVVFTKADILYALDRARSAIASSGHAIVVEGYTDVLALHQAGITNAVASMGTALTEPQVTELRRLCGTVFLAFDADAAGEEASLRGMALAEAKDLAVRVVELPGGRDPADVALADAGAFRRALDGAPGMLTFRVARALHGGGSRDEVYGRVAAILGSARPSIERDEQVRLVADRLDLTDDLAARLQAPGRRAERDTPARARIRSSPRERDERLFLGMCLVLPDRGRELLSELDVAYFDDTHQREVARHVRRLLDRGGNEESDRWSPLVAELVALASHEAASEPALEELYWKLHLYRTDDGLKSLRQNADLDLSQQQELQRLEELRLRLLTTLESVRAQAPDR
ncbi:MAG TPA: DNA primase [Gaiellales bacterium]|nr:DNA primase [Gaiellales bacterium]